MSSNEIRPTLRPDKVYEMRNHLADWLKAYGEELQRTCMTCQHFQESAEACRLFGGARPPARVIAYGCKDYFSPDEIPF